MAGDDQSDPFLWDEDRVVQELCTTNRSWEASPAMKLPDPATFEAKLRECGVDGESLLTYGDEFGFDKLCGYLEVKKFPHQRTLNKAIAQLRKRSPRYREWKAQQLAESQICAEEDYAFEVKSESRTLADIKPTTKLAHVPGTPPGNASRDAELNPALSELAIPCQGVLSPALSPPAEPGLAAVSEPPQSPGVGQTLAEEPPTKRRRIAPLVVSAAPTGNEAFSIIPTEGDVFMSDTVGDLLKTDDASGYLGALVLRCDQLVDTPPTEHTELDATEFARMHRQMPPGRRIQVSAKMKRFLRSGRIDRLKPGGSQKEESPLPVFGESDDDESLDSETWREYQQEEQERLAVEARKEAAKKQLLSKDKVGEIVRNAIQELESRWIAEKKPKQDRKAWRLWQDARLSQKRLAYIQHAKDFSRQLERRISRFTEQIMHEEWSLENDLLRKVPNFLQESVFEKKHQAWRIEVLENPRPPPKPSALPKPKSKLVKPRVVEDDEELLTSESEDGDDFIEYDDDVVPGFNDEMVVDSDLPPEEDFNDGMEIDSDLLLPGQLAAPAGAGRDHSEDPGANADNDLPPSLSAPCGEEDGNALAPAQPTPKKIKTEKRPVPTTPKRTVPSDAEVIEIASSPPLAPLDDVPGLDDLQSLEKIGEIGVEYWQQTGDAQRLLAAVLSQWSRTRRARIADAINNRDHNEVWAVYLWPIIEGREEAKQSSIELYLFRLFDVFISKTAKRIHRHKLSAITRSRMKRNEALFPDFYEFLTRLIRLFLPVDSQTPTRIVIKTSREGMQPKTPTAKIRDPAEDLNGSDGSSSDAPAPSTKKRRRRKRRDKDAEKLRITNAKLNEEFARRQVQLREKMAESGSMPSDKSRLIVNESKESDDQALIYINDHIGSRIKDHQIDGVRFMWNQVVVDSSVRQGCLLAHTMGLGKTMQVITLLVVIAEASASPDESVRSQIPRSLRQSKTLILCPASLVDNWLEELAMWAPEGLLGPVRRVDSILSKGQRIQTVWDWASSGGVLIVGYNMFKVLVQGDEETTARLLHETPNLVIGDEAHMMKNPGTQVHQATSKFKTMNRIAMTGSPLTNNVMDYYAMINWVAPNYLADIAEFKERFWNPIREGLYVDSEPHQKRKARRMLNVLKATVDPKVHRRDIEVLVSELPAKKEFIITLPLTKLQMRLYETYIEWVAATPLEQKTGQARAWSLVAKLGLVLAHPIIFKTVVEAQKEKPARGIGAVQPLNLAGGEGGDEDSVPLPQEVLIKLLSTVAVREIEDYRLSNKILVLLRILDECKKVGDKVLVFSQSISTLDYLENIFKRQRVVYQRLDGKTPLPERQSSVKKFNADSSSEVYLISTKAGGVGLNIYGANRVVIFDFKYTPADEQQAIGRAYRLGQTKPVYVYWLTIGGTFEDTIHNNAVFKTQLASRVVDKKNPDPWSKRYSEYFTMPKIPDQADLSEAFGQDQVLDALLKSEDLGKLVRKITSTETFEKEETYELPPEDQQEAAQDIALELLRSRNPEEFRRRQHERVWQSRIDLGMAPPPLSHQPRPADGEFQTAPSCTGNRGNRIVKIKVPEHLREKRDSVPPSSSMGDTLSVPAQGTLLPFPQPNHNPLQQVLTQSSDTPLVTPTTPCPRPPNSTPTVPPQALVAHDKATAGKSGPGPTVAEPPQAPAARDDATAEKSTTQPKQAELNNASAPDSKTTELQPILGAGTHYKDPSAPSPSAPPSDPSPQGTPAAAPDSDLPHLFGVHNRLCQEGRHVRYHPNDLAARVEGVLAQNKVEGLPLMDKMQNLKKYSRNPRFAEAMLSGHLEPEQLASMTRSEMEEMSASLRDMPEAEFKQRVWTSKADLNHLRAKKSTQTKAERRKESKRVLRFIKPEPRPQAPSTPKDGQRAVKPGDSADTPHIID